MDLKPLHRITIGDLVEVAGIMKLQMSEAAPKMQVFCTDLGIKWKPDGQAVCLLAKKLLEGERVKELCEECGDDVAIHNGQCQECYDAMHGNGLNGSGMSKEGSE